MIDEECVYGTWHGWTPRL